MEVTDYIFEQTKGIVQTGPFKGMKLLRETSWKDTALSPMLLGTHEEELHGLIEEKIARNPSVVVNVGCAEGYYAVGLAIRLPKATVWAIDTDPNSLQLCQELAELNDVRVVTSFDVEDAFHKPDFIMMDCEGGEIEYLDFERYPALLNAHIIAEIHNTPGRMADDILYRRWKEKDHIVAYMEGSRNPNRFQMLIDKPSKFRWEAVCENRPCAMGWYHMWPQ